MSARVLVVDDIPANVKLLEIKLTAEYFEVFTAMDGPTALELAEQIKPDVILSDVMMPGMDGFELCAKLKASARTRHVPVVMVTALSDVSDRVRGLQAGADDFLTKPVNDVALFARVRSLARLKLMIDELRIRRSSTGQGGALVHQDEPAEIDLTDPKVLLAEASSLNAARLVGYLEHEDYRVKVAGDSAEVFAAAEEEDYDLIVVNLHFGQEDGLRVCSQLRSQDRTRHIPILLVLDDDELPQLAKGLDLGVTDYLMRPIDRNELQARCRTQVRRQRYHARLRAMLHQSVSMAYTDALTEVFNRRYMSAHLDRAIMEIAEHGKTVSAIIFDIDHFKRVNDTHGHHAGDEVLKEVARRVSESLRDTDMVARYGGEEFVVVLPDSDPEVALSVAERLRCLVSHPAVRLDDGSLEIPITVSLGVASTTDPLETQDSLISRADRALYVAKNLGRNRVVSAELDAQAQMKVKASA